MPTTYASDPDSLPPKVEQLLKSCPQSGSGNRSVHRWLLEVANCLRHHKPAEQAAAMIRQHISRRPELNEIEEAISKAYAGQRVSRARRQSAWPQPNLESIAEIVDRYTTPGKSKLAELRSSSPAPIPATSDEIIGKLFPGNPLLCVAIDPRSATTAPISELGNLSRYSLLVPSPMTTRFWFDTRGKRHDRGLSNTGPRQFIVTDFDLKETGKNGLPTIYSAIIAEWWDRGLSPQDAMAAIILYLAEQGPLSLVVFSGSVSLQSWWYCRGEREEIGSQMRKFFAVAVALGTDPQGWTPCQLFRMPGAVRPQTQRPQTVEFFNPQFVSSHEDNPPEVSET
jgi:hypothetical protein